MAPSAPSYPGARPEPRSRIVIGAEPYHQYQSTADVVAVGAALAEVITFNGYPDSIVLTATAGSVLVELRDLVGPVSANIFVPVGDPVETHVRARSVFAVRPAGVAAANLHVVGKWSEAKLSAGDMPS